MNCYYKGLIVSSVLVCAFSGFAIIQSLKTLGITGLAPDNLRTSAEYFKLRYAVESSTTITPKYADSVAWSEFNGKLNEYATQLELLEESHDFQRMLYLSLSLISSIALYGFGMKLEKEKQKGGDLND